MKIPPIWSRLRGTPTRFSDALRVCSFNMYLKGAARVSWSHLISKRPKTGVSAPLGCLPTERKSLPSFSSLHDGFNGGDAEEIERCRLVLLVCTFRGYLCVIVSTIG